MIEDKIIDNSFDKVDYGTERTVSGTIQISPFVSDRYEESVSENIDEVYTRRRLTELMDVLYKESEYYNKYGTNLKKIERCDLLGIYYYFKNELLKQQEFTIIQIFCTIAEFFDLNYKTLYNDILTLEDKVNILETLEKEYGLEKQFSKSKPLF